MVERVAAQGVETLHCFCAVIILDDLHNARPETCRIKPAEAVAALEKAIIDTYALGSGLSVFGFRVARAIGFDVSTRKTQTGRYALRDALIDIHPRPATS